MIFDKNIDKEIKKLGHVRSMELLRDTFSLALEDYMRDPKVLEMSHEEQERLIMSMHREKVIEKLSIRP